MGAEPAIGKSSERIGKRKNEIWDTFARVLQVCEEEKIDLLLIAGDLFHRQPLKKELKEVNYMFSKLSVTQVVMIIGNHDYLKRESYYRDAIFPKNVHVILSQDLQAVLLPEYDLAVYGLSYHAREIAAPKYRGAYARRRMPYEILLGHGGDEKHIPVTRDELLELGYDYVALGHIHKPQILCPDRIAYAGALEPIDKNDVGAHGYIRGEITTKGCKITFVPFALREYVHIDVEVSPQMTEGEIRDEIAKKIQSLGVQNIYKVTIKGHYDPEIYINTDNLDVYGNVIEFVNETLPSYDFARIKRANEGNILGSYIASFAGAEEGSKEFAALCAGVKAMMETREAGTDGI